MSGERRPTDDDRDPCPCCCGLGEIDTPIDVLDDGGECETARQDCPNCNGLGYLGPHAEHFRRLACMAPGANLADDWMEPYR